MKEYSRSTYKFLLIIFLFIFNGIEPLQAQNHRKINKEIRKNLKIILVDLKVLKKMDIEMYPKYISNDSLFNRKSRLDFLYKDLDARLNLIDKNIKYSNCRFRLKKKKIAKILKVHIETP